MSQHYDVAVVGASLEGCCLCVLLAKSGLKVILLDNQPSDQIRLPFEDGSLLQEVGIDEALTNGPLIPQLILIAAQYPNFTYLGETGVTSLLWEANRVMGIKAHVGQHEESIISRLVVASDGSDCILRDLAGIVLENGKIANRLTIDGFLLLGEAAHPNLSNLHIALEEAIIAHPIIVQALSMTHGIASANGLRPFESSLRKNLQKRKGILRQIFSWLTGKKRVCVDTTHFKFMTPATKRQRYYTLTVDKVVQETPEASSFYFNVPEELKNEFSYAAGQFITLRFLEHSHLYRRCYSLSSAPGCDPYLRITIKKISGGLVSQDLDQILKQGTSVLVLPPAGNFVPNVMEGAHHIFITGGSGITPIYSILKTVLTSSTLSTATLIDANHCQNSIIFRKELEALRDTYPQRLQVIHHLSKDKGRLNTESLSTLLNEALKSGPSAKQFYLCGPEGYMAMAEDVLHQLRIDPHSIHREKYTSIEDPFEEPGIERKMDKPLIVGVGNTSDLKKQVRIKLQGKTHHLDCEPDETILDAALRNNLPAPFSCREGLCATCLASLKEGKVKLTHHYALTDEDVRERKILTCQARPLTAETEVDYDV